MAKKSRGKPHVKQTAFEHLDISSLERHRRQGSTLTPPLATIPQLNLASWRDAGLNEILWAAILCGDLDRQIYLDLFRRFVANARTNIPDRQNTFLTHSVLSVLENDTFEIFAAPLLKHDRARELLRSLLLLECLPDRQHWARYLEAPDPETHSVFLMKAVLPASIINLRRPQTSDG
jgi:hypothetical protein